MIRSEDDTLNAKLNWDLDLFAFERLRDGKAFFADYDIISVFPERPDVKRASSLARPLVQGSGARLSDRVGLWPSRACLEHVDSRNAPRALVMCSLVRRSSSYGSSQTQGFP